MSEENGENIIEIIYKPKENYNNKLRIFGHIFVLNNNYLINKLF